MAIVMTCECGKRLRATEPQVGQWVQCPDCGSPVQVPRSAEAPPKPVATKSAAPPARAEASKPRPAASAKPAPSPPQPAAKAQPVGGWFGPERAIAGMGSLGGVLMMLIAALWFFAGLYFGALFFYPPLLFVVGLGVFIYGLLTGNIAGKRRAKP